jgi:hypothetical protein
MQRPGDLEYISRNCPAAEPVSIGSLTGSILLGIGERRQAKRKRVVHDVSVQVSGCSALSTLIR